MSFVNVELQKLILLCKKGKNKAQKELYRRYYAYALTVCLHYCYNRAEAEDVLIEGFYKMFTNIKQYDSDKEFKPWFRKILVHAAIDHHRKYNKLKITNEEITNSKEELLEVNAFDRLNYDDLLNILQQLPNQYRIVFNLYEIEGYSHKEIANQLKIKESTSKSNLTRAKQKLQKVAKEFGVTTKITADEK